MASQLRFKERALNERRDTHTRALSLRITYLQHQHFNAFNNGAAHHSSICPIIDMRLTLAVISLCADHRSTEIVQLTLFGVAAFFHTHTHAHI